MSAYSHGTGIKHQEQKPKAGHKQGRIVHTADGFLAGSEGELIDLHGYLTGHRHSVHLTTMATGILRASGVLQGGILVVDKALKPEPGDMVYVRFDGIPLIRRIVKKNGSWALVADDPREPVLFIGEETTVERLGVVTWALNPLRRGA